MDDVVDAPGRDIYRLGQLILAHTQRREELLQWDLPGCTGGMTVLCATVSCLVVVTISTSSDPASDQMEQSATVG